jgi:hypothetical protein
LATRHYALKRFQPKYTAAKRWHGSELQCLPALSEQLVGYLISLD